MWKKISVAAMLGLSFCPSAAMAEFNPFEGIVDGIAMELAAHQNLSLSSNYDVGGRQGGNVVVGNGMPAVRQNTVVDGDLSLEMRGSSDSTAQAANLHKGDVAVMVMQNTAVTGAADMLSSNSANSTQAYNLVTSCGAAGCE